MRPINTAEAANYYSTSSVAAADADQIVILDQSIDVTPDEQNGTDGKRLK